MSTETKSSKSSSKLNNKTVGKTVKKMPKKTTQDNGVVDKNTEKYKVALKFVNKILVNIGKEEIDDLTKFKDIDRDDVIEDINKTTLEEMEEEVFKYFDKNGCNYYRKTNGLVVNCLRGMMRQLGLSMTSVKKDITSTINGKKYRKSHMFYSVNQVN